MLAGEVRVAEDRRVSEKSVRDWKRQFLEGEQSLALSSEVLFGGRDAGVANADASQQTEVLQLRHRHRAFRRAVLSCVAYRGPGNGRDLVGV